MSLNDLYVFLKLHPDEIEALGKRFGTTWGNLAANSHTFADMSCEGISELACMKLAVCMNYVKDTYHDRQFLQPGGEDTLDTLRWFDGWDVSNFKSSKFKRYYARWTTWHIRTRTIIHPPIHYDPLVHSDDEDDHGDA